MIGDKIAAPANLDTLMAVVSKDVHLLRVGDLHLQDKTKYDAVIRLMKPHIRELLQNHVPGNHIDLLLSHLLQILIFRV